MATNWTLANATKEILAGNKEATQDIGRRFPLTLAAIAKMGNNEGAIELINALPEHITTRKIESVLKDGVVESEVDTDDEEEVKTPDEVKEEKKAAKKEEKKPRKKKEEVKEEEAEEEDEYSGMLAMELYKLCKKRGLKVEPKQKQDVYAKALRDDDAKGSEDDWEEEEEEVKPAKKAAEKKAAKKPAKKVEEVEDDEDDDWDI